MSANGDSRELIRRIAERSVAPPRAIRYGEDMRTMMVGSLSASLGLAVVTALINSMLNKPMYDWNVRESYGAFVLSSLAAVVAIVGMMLGFVGLRLGWKAGRRVSIISAFGVLCCYLSVVISLIFVLYHEIAYWF